MLWSEIPSQNLREGRSAYLNVEQWRSQSKSFADMAFFDPVSVTLTTQSDGANRSVSPGSRPTSFHCSAFSPCTGRSFSAEEAEQRQRLALISHRFWQTRFGGSLDAIGASIELDGLPSRIIGILPAGFQICGSSMRMCGSRTRCFRIGKPLAVCVGAGSWFVVGRLRPNVTFEQAQAEMSAIARRLDEQLPASDRNRGISVVPLSLQLTGPRLAAGIVDARGRGFLCAPHRRHQRREPLAGSQRRPRKGDRHSSGARRQPCADRPAVARRKPDSGRRIGTAWACWWPRPASASSWPSSPGTWLV